MASIISAGTTSGTSLNLSGDTSGVLQLATNGSTTAVTISTGQLVGIGTTSPDGLLTLPATASNTPKIRLQSATSDVDVTITSYADSTGTYAAFASNFYLNSTGDEAVFDSAKRSSFIRVDGRSTGAITFGTADTGVTPERMRITSGGRVCIGTTEANRILNVYESESTANSSTSFWNLQYGGIAIRNTSDTANTLAGISLLGGSSGNSASGIANIQESSSLGALGFYTGGSGRSNTVPERMRITSGGDLFLGATTSALNATRFLSFSDTSQSAVTGRCTSSSQASDIFLARASRNTTNGSFQVYTYYNDGAGAYRFVVSDSGNVTNTNGSYGTISDARLKENIVDATSKLDKVNQLKVRNFNLIGDDLKQIGFIAQEFEQVFPSMVEESQDRTPDGELLGTTTKTIKTTVLIPILVKAIQEQQAMIETLQAEVAALKGVN